MGIAFDTTEKSPEELVLKENVPITLKRGTHAFFMTNDYTVIAEKLNGLSCRLPLPSDFIPTPELPENVRAKMKALHATWSFSLNTDGDILNYYDGTEPPYCLFLDTLTQDGKEFSAQKMRDYIIANKTTEIEELVKSGYDIRLCLQYDATPLIVAVLLNSYDSVSTLLRLGADANAANSNRMTPLMNATFENSIESVKILLADRNINLEAKDCSEMTALLWAVENDNLEITKLLVKAGADINAVDNTHNTPLINSIAKENDAISEFLIDSGADVNIPDEHGFTPLMSASMKNNFTIAEKLISFGADINAKDKFGCTAFMYAAGSDGSNIVDFFIRIGVSTEDRVFAVKESAEHGSCNALEVLLKNKGSFTMAATYALAFACQKNKPDVIPLCARYDGDVNFTPFFGMTLLMEACYIEADIFAEKLLECGADVNRADDYGMTALMYAASKNNFNLIQMLLENGADRDMTSKAGKTFEDYRKTHDSRSYTELYNERLIEKRSELLEQDHPDEIPAGHQTFNNRFDWYKQKYFQRFPANKPADIYKVGGISKKTFSKIQSNNKSDFRPKKETVISLAVGLKLSLNEAEDFLQSAGYAFSDTDKADVIAKELFSQKNYDKFDWSQRIYEKTGRMFFKSEGM